MNTETKSLVSHSWANWRAWPYLLVGMAVALRIAHILISRSNPTFWSPAVDPEWYDQYALNILQGSWGPFPLFRAPFYPTLLAATYGVFGHDLLAARMLNVLLQGVACWAIWRVTLSYFSSAVAVVATAYIVIGATRF